MQAAVHIETFGPFCPKCDALIESSLGRLPGVSAVRSSYSLGLTSVMFDLNEIDTGMLADEIRRCGFRTSHMVLRQLEAERDSLSH